MNSALIQRTILPLLSAGLLAAVVVSHLKPTPTVPTTQPISPPALPVKSASAIDYQAMLSWHLFGTAPTGDAAKPPTNGTDSAVAIDETKLPPANVDLKLHGIAYGIDRTRAYAILANPYGSQKKYRAGDTVKDDIAIDSIRARGVVLKHAGRLEMLELPKDSSGGANPNINIGTHYLPPGMMQPPANIPTMQALRMRPPVSLPAPLSIATQAAQSNVPPASAPEAPPAEAQFPDDQMAAPSNN